MKKVLFFSFLILTFSSNAQKIIRIKYFNGIVKYEYQVNSNGVKNGYYKYFADDGYLVESGFYKQGEKSGLWTTYDENGRKGQIYMTSNYANDKLNGENKVWCWQQVEEKVVRYLCAVYMYKNDEEVSSIKYNVNNTISSKSVPNGKCFNSYSNGKIKEEWVRENGETIAGTYKTYLKNGKPEIETINGKTYTYNTDGDCYGKTKEITWDSSHFVCTNKYECSGIIETFVLDTVTNRVRKLTINNDDSTIQICKRIQFEDYYCIVTFRRFSVQKGKQTIQEYLLNSKNEFVTLENLNKDERDLLLDARNRKWSVVTKNEKNIIIEKYIYNEYDFLNSGKTISWEKFDEPGLKITQ